jgi:dinuclear metal center YbgI/SA1388 family protein
MSIFIDEIVNFIEKDFADIRRQSSWDFSGRQIYLGNNKVDKIYLALDASECVVDQAIERGYGLLITHHPLFFTPIKGLNINKTKDNIIIKAIKNNLTILSYHTNLDMASYNTNTHLIKLLNAETIGTLSKEGELDYVKLTVFTPISHENAVLDVIDEVGGGKIGNYRRCAFSVQGVGTFTPLSGSKPYIGTEGKAEHVAEVRQEVLLPINLTDKVISAVKKAHPYETPALDITSVKGIESFGFGNITKLDKKYSLDEFIVYLKEKLGIKNVRTNMDNLATFDLIAVCSGSGASLWKDCLRHGVKVLITSDLKHHEALDAKEAGVCIIDIGHFHSEQIYMGFLAKLLAEKFNIPADLAAESPSILDL